MTLVEVTPTATKVVYTARVLQRYTGEHGRPIGLALVEVVDPGNSDHRPGDQLRVGTITLRPISENEA